MMAIDAVSWATAMAVEHIASYIADTMETSMVRWKDQMSNLTTSEESKAIEGGECLEAHCHSVRLR